jgi:hypothetical protein
MGCVNLTHCSFGAAAFASAANADRHEMRAWTETARAAAVWGDTTRLHPMGQEGGLSVSGPVSERPTNRAESSNLSALMKREVLAYILGCARKASSSSNPRSFAKVLVQ